METRYNAFEPQWGFLTSQANSAWNENPDFDTVHVPQLPIEQAQYCRLRVEGADRKARQHLVFMPHQPVLSPETCAQIAALVRPVYPDATPTFLYDQDGKRCQTMSDRNPAESAAAVAEAIRSGSLDDIEWLDIGINETDFKVQILWMGRYAEAKIIEVAG